MRQTLQFLVAISVVALSSAASAQADEWRVTPYLWAAGFDGTVGLPGNGAGLGDRIDVTTEDFSDNVRLGGIMIHATWRRGRWTAFGDWTYASVKSDSPTRFATLYSGVDVKLKGHVVEGYAGYDLLGGGSTHLDVFGGIRYYNLDLELGLREGALPGTLVSRSDDWVDGVVGVRWDTRFDANWEAFASADVGGGGSDLSWQLFAGVGYRFAWGSVVGGWRYLHVDYDKRGYRLDAAITGPFIGASFQF